jgi:hypothetical protein
MFPGAAFGDVAGDGARSSRGFLNNASPESYEDHRATTVL